MTNASSQPTIARDSRPASDDAEESLIRVRVLTPNGETFKGEGTSLRFRAADGDVEIHPGYEPSIYALDIWPVALASEGAKSRKLAVHGGFLRAAHDEVVILADAAETREKIDIARAESAKERAEKRLAATALEREGISLSRAELALKRAIARINAKK